MNFKKEIGLSTFITAVADTIGLSIFITEDVDTVGLFSKLELLEVIGLSSGNKESLEKEQVKEAVMEEQAVIKIFQNYKLETYPH